MWFIVACFWCQNFGDVSPYVCSLYFKFGLGYWVTTFREIAVPSVAHLFSLYFVYLWFWLFSLHGFESGICPLIAPVPVHCFLITFKTYQKCCICITCKHAYTVVILWLKIYMGFYLKKLYVFKKNSTSFKSTKVLYCLLLLRRDLRF